MNLLFIADGRSPTAQSWIANMQKDGHKVALISTYPCTELPGLTELHILPVAFSGLAARPTGVNPGNEDNKPARRIIGSLRSNLLGVRHGLGPLTLPFFRKKYLKIVNRIGPEVIHALRIPFEGMLARYAEGRYPLVVSIWGNDLTLHANGSYRMGLITQQTLKRTDGLMADAGRDIRLAKNWGFDHNRPNLVVPGCGGIDLEKIEVSRTLSPKYLLELIPPNRRLIVNPRGLRPGSLRTDVFFGAAGIVAARHPDVCFVCPAMAGQPNAIQMVKSNKLEHNVILLPILDQMDLWWLYTRAEAVVSPGVHDGIPNSLLEALACGCYPVAGDIESIREWITPGINGLLYPPSDTNALAESLLLILDNPDRRFEAARCNLKLIHERANQITVRKKVSDFYQLVAGHYTSLGDQISHYR
ncbi:MAG: glycosyltransferase family 4 protein [Anaerolineaceae bacterium]|nr:glycosyltransferase family 4 protein [Anaerolineaceae bacterium]